MTGLEKANALDWLNDLANSPAGEWQLYYSWSETKINATNVLAMLKEQEPILLENQHKPYGISTNANSPWISRCPRCGKKVEGKQTRFCKYCGQAVKWND